MAPAVENSLALSPLPGSPHRCRPLCQREAPVSRNQYPAKYVHHLNNKPQKAIPSLLDCEQQWLDVVFEKYSRYRPFTNDMRLLRDSVLVGADSL